MSRKDFQLIADSLRAGRYDGMTATRVAIHNDYCKRMADSLASTNPRFDRARFLEACGVN